MLGFRRPYLLLLVVLLSGCADAGDSEGSEAGLSSSPWKTEIRAEMEALKGHPNEEFALSVLQDGVVSQAEYLEARSQLMKCVKDAGVENIRILEGEQGYEVNGTPEDPEGKRAWEVVDKCGKDLAFPPIEAFYNTMKLNPNNEDPNQLIAACLVLHKVVDPSYSADDYQREFRGYIEEHSDSEGQVAGDPSLALSYTVPPEEGADVLRKCESDPAFRQGNE